MFIGVYVSDAEGARRENARGNRHAGWNRGSARSAHAHSLYDLTVDTTDQSPEDCASAIKRALDEGVVGAAFETLRGRRAGSPRAPRLE